MRSLFNHCLQLLSQENQLIREEALHARKINHTEENRMNSHSGNCADTNRESQPSSLRKNLEITLEVCITLKILLTHTGIPHLKTEEELGVHLGGIYYSHNSTDKNRECQTSRLRKNLEITLEVYSRNSTDTIRESQTSGLRKNSEITLEVCITLTILLTQTGNPKPQDWGRTWRSPWRYVLLSQFYWHKPGIPNLRTAEELWNHRGGMYYSHNSADTNRESQTSRLRKNLEITLEVSILRVKCRKNDKKINFLFTHP